MNSTASELRAAARRCVAEQGVAGTTSRRIAVEANANLAAITYHFGSKDHLIAEALLEGIRELLAPALEVLDRLGDPAERTVQIVTVLLRTLDEHRGEAVAYLQALAHAPLAPLLRDGVARLWTDLRERIVRDMTLLQGAGIVGPWVEPDAMAGVFIAVANGLLVQSVVDPDGPAVTDLATQFALLLLQARVVDPAAEPS